MIDFTLKRIEKVCEALDKLVYDDRVPVVDIFVKEGDYHTLAEAEAAAPPWRPFREIGAIGGVNYHAWLWCEITIPPALAGKEAALLIHTDTFRAGWAVWSSIRPQFLVFVNGEIRQAADQNHQEITLCKNAVAGETLRVDFPVFNGFVNMDGEPAVEADLRLELVSVERRIRGLYYDIKVPLMVADKLDVDSKERVDILAALTGAINILDLRKPRSTLFYESLQLAQDGLRKGFYGEICGRGGVSATFVGATHIDVTWLWDLAQTRKKAARSFATALRLMDEYPQYIFMCGQPQLYQYVKEDHPDLYEKIREKVASGQWEAEGAMWVEAECTVASGETMIRQILFGKRFFREEFGVECRVFWAPDIFGFNGALPQILRKSGIDYFTTTKITWNRFNKPPYDTFLWRGIDGTDILTYFPTTMDVDNLKTSFKTIYEGNMTPGEIIGSWKRYQQKDLNDNLFGSYGYGDGGGGPSFEMIEQMNRMAQGIPGCPTVISGRVLDYFVALEERLAGKRLPVWEDELLMESHYGIFSAMGMIKKLHRRSELLMRDAEYLCSFAMRLGEPYPRQELTAAWERILLNDNCDTLAGASIKEAYDEAAVLYEEVIEIAAGAVNRSIAAVNRRIRLECDSVVVHNTLSHTRSDLTILELPAGASMKGLARDDGVPVEFQALDDRRILFYAADIPPFGYRSFRVSDRTATPSPALRVSETGMENDFFRIAIDDAGCFSSIFDKRCSREVLRPGQRGNLLLAFEDRPLMYDNYITEIYYQEKMWEILDLEGIEVLETGSLRAGIRVRRRFLDSTITQDIYLYRDLDRIDIVNDIDWREQRILLKAAFPVDIHTRTATYDIPYGNLERPTHNNTPFDLAKFEVPGHKWVDLSEDGYGVSLLNDCKYGYDIKNGCIRVTLIKSGIAPNTNGDMGRHRFVYALYPHRNDWRGADTVNMAYGLNVPLYPRMERAHGGELESVFSYLSTDSDHVLVEVIKKAEVGGDIVVRLVEYKNRRGAVTLTLCRSIVAARLCDLMETDEQPLQPDGNRLRVYVKPYEILTLKLRLLE